MRRICLFLIGILSVLGILLYACGGDGGGSSGDGGDNPPTTGILALYVTDDLSDYKQVMTTINSVQILHTGTNTTCDVLTNPVTPITLDLANLSSVLQLLNVTNCQIGDYNRIHVEFNKSVELMNQDDSTAICTYTQYKKDNNQPNVLHCNETICYLDINGAVNVLANQAETLVLDFDLKDFDVEYSQNDCYVTMKVSPLNASGMNNKKNQGYKEGVSGFISDLNVTNNTFVVLKVNKTFTIDYSQITQPHIDDLLQFAVTENLKVKVESISIDLNTNTCTASAIYVKVEGIVSNLDTSNKKFTLTYDEGKSITVDYSEAFNNNCVEGSLSNGVYVEVKLYGYDNVSGNYLAYKVQVQGEGTETED